MSAQGIMIYSIVIQILGVLALLCVAGAVVGIPMAFGSGSAARLGKVFRSEREPIVWAAIIATTATLGSLYLSEIVGFAPCRLCWFQRFAMYPLMPILWFMAWKRLAAGWWVGVLVAGIGASISALHIFEQAKPDLGLAPCGTGVPCSARYVAVFGFISIPVLAGSAFLAIIALMLITRLLGRAAETGSEG